MNSLSRIFQRSAWILAHRTYNYVPRPHVISRGVPAIRQFVSFKSDEINKKYLAFTCKVCNERNSYIISKIAYEKGVVIVECQKCKNNHLIADNLKFFRDKKTNIEDILREKGEKLINSSSNTYEFLEDQDTKPVIPP